MTIAIINYGASNLYSVKNCLNKLKLKSIITSDDEIIKRSSAAILPGVGAFGQAMHNIKRLKLDYSIYKFIETGKPFLAICLGMQLLFETSFEFSKNKGLGLLQGDVKLINSNKNLKVPHIGWNKINLVNPSTRNSVYLKNYDDDFMYFVHSYYVDPTDKKIVLTTTNYQDFIFCSSVEYKNIIAFQFHPEKSGEKGLNIFKNLKKKIS